MKKRRSQAEYGEVAGQSKYHRKEKIEREAERGKGKIRKQGKKGG